MRSLYMYDLRLISFRPGEFQIEEEFYRTNRYLVRGEELAGYHPMILKRLLGI